MERFAAVRSISLLILASFTLFHCGKDVAVNIDENTYDPKIVIEGYLFPGRTVEGIRIMRNYGLNMKIDLNQIVIRDAEVMVIDEGSGDRYDLIYDPPTFAYRYPGEDLIIRHGRQYRLSVSASIDGKELWASSVATVPQSGFHIDEAASSLGPLKYREKDGSQGERKIEIWFNRTVSTDSYISSIIALDASLDNFIEDNSFGLKKEDLAEEERILAEITHQAQWTQTQLGEAGRSSLQIEWFSIWFYGRYRVIVYAADKNFTDFFLTHRMVQEIDGNLIEPKFHFQGDGIGVFGAADPDTVHFEIVR